MFFNRLDSYIFICNIYLRLEQKSPKSKRNISVQRLAQTLSAIGIERIHTRYGNLYRVVSHPSQ